jgi:histidine ammonia-lyase
MLQPRVINRLTLDDVVAVARHQAPVTVPEAVLARVAEGRAIVEGLAESTTPAYGISTGFGALATVTIHPARRKDLQRSLIRSHAAGTGELMPTEVVRAMMLLRLKTMSTGLTGVRPVVVETYAAMLNAQVTPAVRQYGSLGCSGDLAPLAHVALAAMGEGEVLRNRPTTKTATPRSPHNTGEPSPQPTRPAADALTDEGITPLVYLEKEGLALINGTDGMLGLLALALHDLDHLLRLADLTAAMTVEALLGTDRVFAADLQALRPQVGQADSAANLRRLLADSPIMASHRDDHTHLVQDAYSLRCTPAVHGAARDTAAFARTIAERELAAAIDNPVVLPDGRVESNGNFHGAPIGYVLDFLAIAVADVASISERRIDKTLDRSRNQGLPPFLALEVGVDSGYMIAQYAAAGIVSNLKRLAAPASVDSIPSSAMQEDHVSMGWAAGLKLRESIDGLHRVLAIELLTAGRALDLRAPLVPAAGTGAALGALRTAVSGPGPDAIVSAQIEQAVALVGSGRVMAAVEHSVGHLA